MDLLKSLKHKAQLAKELSLADWVMLIEAWGQLFFFRIALFRMSYQRLRESTQKLAGQALEPTRALILSEHIGRLVGFASRLHLIPMTCLVRSLALQKMLRRRNIPAQVKIGAQKVRGVMNAHAWVEVNGKPIGEGQDIGKIFNVLESAVEYSNRQFV